VTVNGLMVCPSYLGKVARLSYGTCRDTLAATYIPLTSKKAGDAARLGEDAKRIKYKELFSRFCFLPFSVETVGPWGADAKKCITLLGKKISSMSNDNKSTLYLTQRISLAIQRGNAASVLGTIPQSPDLEEIFYILK
jgi:hypothetical protein